MKKKNGYTIIELLVIIAMIASVIAMAILGGIAWHFISKYW
jgi:type II secretory pathway pseudopilin PulG